MKTWLRAPGKKGRGWLVTGLLLAGLLAAHVGITPSRSEDLRVALQGDCPIAQGSLESAASAVDLVAALGQVMSGPVIKAAAQISRSYAQPHVSRPLSGATSEHFHLLGSQGELLVNKQVWGCLVITVTDLRAPPVDAGTGGAAPDPFSTERVFLEARVVHAADGSAFDIQPLTLRFRAPEEATILGSSARDLRFELTFDTPGAQGPFARTVLSFNDLVPSVRGQFGVDVLGSMLSKRSGWLVSPRPSAQLQERSAMLNKASGAEARQPSAQTPATVHVTFWETREASVLWRYIANVLEAFAQPASGDARGPSGH